MSLASHHLHSTSRWCDFADELQFRVLVVEDSPDYSALIRRMLATTIGVRFEVEERHDWNSASKCLARGDYDALVLDLGLPDSDGIGTIRRAASVSSQLPVVCLTACADPAVELRAYKHGAQEYLVKDRIDRRLLPGAILRAINRHQRTGVH